MRRHSLIAGLAAALAFSRIAMSQEYARPPPPPEPTAYDRPLAVAAYSLAWAGSYDAGGIGGRVSWEIIPHRLGIDLFAEALFVNWPGAFRYDLPNGFNAYVPFQLGPRVRLRPLFGACDVFSFVQASAALGPTTEDVLFGLHTGVGLQVLVGGPVTWFLDAQAFWYLGHAQLPGWGGGAIGSTLVSSWLFQPSTGFEFHFGPARSPAPW